LAVAQEDYLAKIAITLGGKSPFHSLTGILANKQRKLVLTPDFNILGANRINGKAQ
jgi:hypothetical protein